jgi:hypothetical protein
MGNGEWGQGEPVRWAGNARLEASGVDKGDKGDKGTRGQGDKEIKGQFFLPLSPSQELSPSPRLKATYVLDTNSAKV